MIRPPPTPSSPASAPPASPTTSRRGSREGRTAGCIVAGTGDNARMPDRSPLKTADIEAALDGLAPFSLRKGRLHAEFVFPTFAEAMSFMTRVAADAEELDHHPDWSNSHRRVTIELVTHSAGGVTALDVELARRICARSGTGARTIPPP
jgi:4a-hydroxytetrahydrobiopterin dehydratase